MPRPNRSLLLPGYPLHVLQRGHNKEPCFLCEGDHTLYLGLLQEYSKKHGCAIHAYVLMTNHIHLLVSPPDIPSISQMMQGVNQVFGQHLNRKNERCGSVWQGRFKAVVVNSEAYFMTCQRYIELNPVRAGMVGGPGRYRWSSYCTNAEGQPSTFLLPHRRYLELAATPEERQAVYRSLFGSPISDEDLSRIRASIQRGKPLGDDAFGREVARRHSIADTPLLEVAEARAAYGKPGPGPGQAPVFGF